MRAEHMRQSMSKDAKKRPQTHPQTRRWMKWIIEAEADTSALPFTRENRRAKKDQKAA